MSYSFNTDYTTLSVADISFDILNKNLEVIITESSPASANSVFTGNFGGIYAIPNYSSAKGEISDTDFFIDFGDGNIVENNLSAFHSYSAPGNYPVTLVVTNSAGYLLKAVRNYVINVKDPVPDKIFLTQNSDLQNESEGTVSFYVTRFNSLKLLNCYQQMIIKYN